MGAPDIISSYLYSSPSEFGWKYGLPLFQHPMDVHNVINILMVELTKLNNSDLNSVFAGVSDLSQIMETV